MHEELDMELMEIFEGEAIYYHSEDCPSYCDFACNGNQGNLIAQAYNAGAKASGGAGLIAVERKRQIDVEGWTPEHDDQHIHGEMCAAAAVYALTPEQRYLFQAEQFWPWDMKWYKPAMRIRELQKAGALIAAEIERLLRKTQ